LLCTDRHMPEPDDVSARYELQSATRYTALGALLAPWLALKSTSQIPRFVPSIILLKRHGLSILMLPRSAALVVSCQIATVSQFFGAYSAKKYRVFDPEVGYRRTTPYGNSVRYFGRKPCNNRRHKDCRLIAKHFCAGGWLNWTARACQQTSAARQADG